MRAAFAALAKLVDGLIFFSEGAVHAMMNKEAGSWQSSGRGSGIVSGLSLGHLRTWCSRPHRAHLGFGQCKYKKCYKFDVMIFYMSFLGPGDSESVSNK